MATDQESVASFLSMMDVSAVRTALELFPSTQPYRVPMQRNVSSPNFQIGVNTTHHFSGLSSLQNTSNHKVIVSFSCNSLYSQQICNHKQACLLEGHSQDTLHMLINNKLLSLYHIQKTLAIVHWLLLQILICQKQLGSGYTGYTGNTDPASRMAKTFKTKARLQYGHEYSQRHHMHYA